MKGTIVKKYIIQESRLSTIRIAQEKTETDIDNLENIVEQVYIPKEMREIVLDAIREIRLATQITIAATGDLEEIKERE